MKRRRLVAAWIWVWLSLVSIASLDAGAQVQVDAEAVQVQVERINLKGGAPGCQVLVGAVSAKHYVGLAVALYKDGERFVGGGNHVLQEIIGADRKLSEDISRLPVARPFPAPVLNFDRLQIRIPPRESEIADIPEVLNLLVAGTPFAVTFRLGRNYNPMTFSIPAAQRSDDQVSALNACLKQLVK